MKVDNVLVLALKIDKNNQILLACPSCSESYNELPETCSCGNLLSLKESDLESILFQVKRENKAAFESRLQQLELVFSVKEEPERISYRIYRGDFVKNLYVRQPYHTSLDHLTGVTFKDLDPRVHEGFKSILFTDLDLTCTNNDKKLSMYVMKLYRLLEEQKIAKIVFTTGRPIPSAYFLARDVGLTPLNICTNGTAVDYPGRIGDLKFRVIEREDCSRLLREVLRVLREKYGLPYKIAYEHSEATDLVLYRKEIGSVEGLKKILEEDFQIQRISAPFGGIALTDSLSAVVHIHFKDHTKGGAIRRFLKATKYPIEDTIFIGNGLNDVSVKGEVGKILAVANAQEEFKAIADLVASRNFYEGTVECLREYLVSTGKVTEDHFGDLLTEVNREIEREVSQAV